MGPGELEVLVTIFVLPAFVIGFFALLFGLGKIFPPERLRRIGRVQFTLWHMMIVVVVTALLLSVPAGRPGPERVFPILILALLILAWFVRVWCNQFVFLMGLRDDDFPGRHDKLIWVFLLFVFAPISVWFFRSYRWAHWPEPEPGLPAQLRPETQGGTATQPA
ncbi:MAG TPA: hypothetical protein VFF52_19645 [Isosphaeraceae bacterium]|nr:hypothetical protein [Isosphaeraceae bacterium]